MAKDIDVYQLVRAFAHKNRLTSIDYQVFAHAVQRQAAGSDQSEAIYRDLAINPDTILLPRLYRLFQDRRVALETVGNEVKTIVMPEHYAEVFFNEYKRLDEAPEIPFPDEESLKVSVPPEWIQAVNIDTDLGILSDRKEEAKVPLYRIIFNGQAKPLVVPQSFVPEKLLECSVLKIRHYLRQGANKDFIFNKLSYAFANKESQLKDALGAVLTKPTEAWGQLADGGGDFGFQFWAYLTSYIKHDLDKKKEKAAEDLGIYQATLLCEFFASHYKGKAKRLLDLESASRSLGQGLRKPPLYFAIEDVLGFRDSQGQPVQGRLSRDDIEAYLKEKTTTAEEGLLPELLVIATGQGRRVYIAKEKVFALVFRLLGELRADCRSRLVQQWSKILGDFQSSPAMEDDEAFVKELGALVASRSPLLDALIQDRLLPLVYEELSATQAASSDISRLFYKGELLPLDELLELDRKSLKVDAKMLLPFWYSVPILSSIMRIFLGSGKKKASVPVQAKAAPPEAQTLKARRAAFITAACQVEAEIVPSGYTLEEYIAELEGRWANLLNPQARRNLVDDVNSLVRDYLRNVLRSLSPSNFTTERVKSLSASLADTPSLLKLKNHAALELYIQLYMVKLLKRTSLH